MNKNNISYRNGMTLPEVVIGMFMLSAFTAIFLLVTEYTNRFFLPSKSEVNGGNGLLIDHHEINMSMDKMIEILSQPGYSYSDIIEISKNCEYQIPPKRIWGLPGNEEQDIPNSYKFCLIPTSLTESNLNNLVSNKNDARPGIYILYASPISDKISINALPFRRIFCRPKPYC